LTERQIDRLHTDKLINKARNGFESFIAINWTPLNGITLGLTITDPINRMITITKYISYANYAIERHLGLVEFG
jgi:hypothetical protein